jgi:Transglutaminase-like superfamily
MQHESLGFLKSDGLEATSSEARIRWLRATYLLDTTTPCVYRLASRLTRLLSDDRAKAVAIHDYVQLLPFGYSPDFSKIKASDVLELGYGDCHTKGVLFIALLRAAGIAARMRFLTISSDFLQGLVDPKEKTITHAVGEVLINGYWWQTDTYVVDNLFAMAARAKLSSEGAITGYGVHLNGASHWKGNAHAHAQMSMDDPGSLPVVDWGVADDPTAFYNNPAHAPLRSGFLMRMKLKMSAPTVNREVGRIRQTIKEIFEMDSMQLDLADNH